MSLSGSIGEYGLLGDTRTGCLVSSRGSIDWLCLPHFDGDPVFARLVAGAGGGRFAMSPAGDDVELVRRRYQPGTAVLETEWRVGAARAVATDGMVADVAGRLFPTMCLVRRVEARGGPVRVAVVYDPRFGIERRAPTFRRGLGLVCADAGLALSLVADRPLEARPGQEMEFEVEPGRPLVMVLTAAHRGPLTFVGSDDAWRALVEDALRWRRWTDRIEYRGAWGETVERSLITLRLLTYSPSGAPVAALTTSLPEWPGGGRNWDYRYAWPRDASIGIGAFLGVGLVDQARAFLYWLLHASRLDRPRLPALLTLHGKPVPPEREVPEWPGFADSRPVRFGNGARHQHQLDNYGWVLDAMWLLVRAGHRLYGETWRIGSALADEVARRWREPDSGLWEVRGEPQHYVHSKLMAWLALDRALCIADVQGASAARQARWRREREAIAVDVVAHGFDADRQTFVRAYGRTDLDAAVLLLPVVGVERRGSPRVRGTIEAIRRELSAGGPLLYRYHRDGLAGPEGAFLPCSFWLVQALAAIGDVDEAVTLMDELCALGGPLGLFAEEADPAGGEMLGNYPQALTHAALVQAALAIRDAQDGSRSSPSASP